MDNANPQAGATQQEPVSRGPMDLNQAAEAFGSLLDDNGDIRRPEPAAQPKKAEARPEAPEEESEVEETEDDSEAPEARADDADEADDGEAEKPADDSEEESGFSSIAELAEALEMSQQELLDTLKTTVTIDGQESEINLSELRNGYQRQADYTRKTAELAEQRKGFHAEAQQVQQQLAAQAHEVQSLYTLAEQQLVGDYQSVNWEQLREVDPAEYAARRQEFIEKAQSLEHHKQQVRAQLAQSTEQQQQAYQQRMAELVKEQSQKLLTALPEWNKPDVAEKERKELREYLKNNGYADEEIESLADHRAVLMLRKAMMFDRTATKADVTKKRIKKLPKVVKPNAATMKSDRKQSERNKKRAALRKSGSTDAAAALFWDIAD